jgi:hypothetical protein
MGDLIVVLNFEAAPDQVNRPSANTVQVLTHKWTVTKDPFPEFVGPNKVVEHRCIRNWDGVLQLVDGATLTKISEDCHEAKKIYAILFGDPRHHDHGFAKRFDGSEGVQLVGSYERIGTFLKQAMPPREKPYYLSLVMCFGARGAGYGKLAADHKGRVNKEHLRSSFAYKLFRELCTVRWLRMTAVTGEIMHNTNSNKALVGNEMLIDEIVKKYETHEAVIEREGKLNAPLLKFRESEGLKTTKDKIGEYKQDPNKDANTPFEIFARSYAEWESDVDNARVKKEFDDAQLAYEKAVSLNACYGHSPWKEKYGKLVYTYRDGKLKIMSKYEFDNIPAGTILYKGPLL